jgi:glycopeptide antibiotics resistance protein
MLPLSADDRRPVSGRNTRDRSITVRRFADADPTGYHLPSADLRTLVGSGGAMIGITTPLVLLVTWAALGVLLMRGRLDAGRWASLALFATYLVGVAHFALLPLRIDPDLAREVGPLDLTRLVELRPFFVMGGFGMPPLQVALNVLLTIPFGFGLPFVRDLRGLQVIAIGVLFCVGVELAQLLADATYLALPTWSIDINDTILNATGVIIGYALFLLTRAAYGATLGRLPVRRGLWAHFHDALTS